MDYGVVVLTGAAGNLLALAIWYILSNYRIVKRKRKPPK